MFTKKLHQIVTTFVVLTIVFSGMQPNIASAQSGDGVEWQVNAQSGRISFIGPENGRALSASRVLGTFIRPQDPAMALAKRFAPEFGVRDPERDLSEMRSVRSEDGRLTVRYQQNYNGIPVMGGELIVNTNDRGDLYSMNGEVSPNLSLPTDPTIDSAQAVETALGAVAKWYGGSSEDFTASEPELWIFDESLLRSSTRPAELVWRMEVTPVEMGMPVRELVLVNAQRGSISLHFNQVDTAWHSDGQSRVPETAIETQVQSSPFTTVDPTASNIPHLADVTWYVATTGDDTNDCLTTTTPCTTIQAAVNKAADGDTIYVAEGIYTGSGNQVVLINKYITLSGGWDIAFTTQNGMSTIDGDDVRRCIIIDDLDSLIADHFIVQNGFGGSGSGRVSGGGIYNEGTLVLSYSIVRDNKSYSYGGGIFTITGTVTINNTSIVNNTSGSDALTATSSFGGGIYSSNGTLIINNSTVSDNNLLGSSFGGGISYDGTLILNNSTVSRNAETGVFARNSAMMLVNNSTIVKNEGYGIGGSGDITLQNTIVSENGNGDCRLYTTVVSQGYNLIGNISNCTFTPNTGDLINVDPKLGMMVGSPGFFSLLPGSPAIDAGNPATCLSTDVRGISRPQGDTCDIGAFEYRGSGTIPAHIFAYYGSAQHVGTGDIFPSTLNVLVLDENGDSVPGIEVSFFAPINGASVIFDDTDTNETVAVTYIDGIATSSILSANNNLGIYTVHASIAELTEPVSFQLINGAEIETYTAKNKTDLFRTLLCIESVTSCTNGDDPHADAAHVYAIGTYFFFHENHDRHSIDNAGMKIISSVHYDSDYQNAFWSESDNVMVYGDAYGYPLADDVVAHELTHGVTQFESNLFYYYQSGAISESFSDLWGEYYDQTNGEGNDAANVKWIIGEDVSGYPIPSGFSVPALRSMSNPPALGDPDKMSSPNYYETEGDSGGVHHNSGINNKTVYLMVDGGTFNGKMVSPLGWEKVGAIYYEVQTNLLISGSDYSDLYYALQQACTNLTGQHEITADDCVEVKDAIDAVEMNAQPAPNFNTHAPLCDVGDPLSTVFFDDLESGRSNWQFGSYIGGTRWQYDSPYGVFATSGEHMLYADDSLPTRTDTVVRTKNAIHIPTGAYIRFSHAFGFEDYNGVNYDGGVFEYSTDDGSTWLDTGSLFVDNGYTGVINGVQEPSNVNNPLAERSAFVRDSHGYIESRLNLKSLADQDVKFRWRMGLDAYVYDAGWWLDDVHIYTCEVPPVEIQQANFSSVAAYDGWILESNETSNNGGTLNTSESLFYLGDDAQNKQYRAILHFDTSSLPDNAVIVDAKLRLATNEVVTGTNPFTTHDKIVIELNTGAYSTSSNLQLDDFRVPSDRNGAGAVQNNLVNGLYRGRIKGESLEYFNLSGATQIRLRFKTDDDDDNVADLIEFFSGNASVSADRPRLVIYYYIP